METDAAVCRTHNNCLPRPAPSHRLLPQQFTTLLHPISITVTPFITTRLGDCTALKWQLLAVKLTLLTVKAQLFKLLVFVELRLIQTKSG